MRTPLTIKLKKITDIASILNRSIFNEYDKYSGTRRGTFLCCLFSALSSRISQVTTIMYSIELGAMYASIVAEREQTRLYLPQPNYSASTDQIMIQANKAVDQIMTAIQKYVESGQIFDVVGSLQNQFIYS